MNTHTHPVHVRLPGDLHQRITERAEREDRNMSSTVRRMLRFADAHMPAPEAVI